MQSIGGEESSRLRSRSPQEVRRPDEVLNEECRCSIGQGDHRCSLRQFRAKKNARLSWTFTQMKNETCYRLCRLKVLCVWVLYLEPTNIILKEESESAIVYPGPRHYYFPLSRLEWNTPE